MDFRKIFKYIVKSILDYILTIVLLYNILILYYKTTISVTSSPYRTNLLVGLIGGVVSLQFGVRLVFDNSSPSFTLTPVAKIHP
jgi:hypothetical protein